MASVAASVSANTAPGAWFAGTLRECALKEPMEAGAATS
jgi:hypothetical protein